MDHPQPAFQRALIVEDEIPLAGIYAKALHCAGYETGEVYDGQAALDLLRTDEETPALVLLDIHLPLVSGNDILQYIRENRRFLNTRVIMATADPAAMGEETEKKADLILCKPISYHQLRDLASRFCCAR